MIRSLVRQRLVLPPLPILSFQLRSFSSAPPTLASLLRQLRESTGAPMVDCKAALVAEGNDIPKAVDWLRKKGLSAVKKTEGRVASQGLVAFALNEAETAGALIELNSETDFVARNALFQGLAARVAQGALATLPASLATVAGEAPSAAAGAAALAAAPLPGGHVGSAPSEACSTTEGIARVIAQVRENMVLRHACVLGGEGALLVPYVHNSPAPGLGSIGVLVALSHSSSSSSSSSAQLPALRQLGRRLAMHIAAASPLYLAKADVPAAALERERAVVAGQSGKDVAGKAPAMAAKILEGKLGKYYGEVVLLEQAFALGGEGGAQKVGAWLQAEGARAGVAGLRVAAFAALRVGAGGGSGSAPVGQ